MSILGTAGLTIQRIVDITHASCTDNSSDDWKRDPDFTFAVLLIVNLGKKTLLAAQ